ncbi:CPBP family intramembrane glutamic endopeptidase [Rhodovulum steppense]|uniref:CAAX prenyl protease 2/Lysostaphin resistance protein A-like domain-containing protein n=1 Tax=Rhodovulum steppense TaxID=540251 RepID=A0A4R1Z0A3_9RHOB|nr:type II CAAX endopeptidase family protein [Rhodovulum steppense]TCM86992.1 hypothetical protein EV216_10369 [Rhodovulum steppense]
MATPRSESPAPADLGTGAILPFLAITFGLSWGILGLWMAAPGPMAALFGEISGSNPSFLLAVYAPAIAALMLVLAQGGRAGLARFLGRLLLWRCAPGWYLVLLVGMPAAFVAGALVKGASLTEPLAVGWGPLLGLVALRSLTGPVEELGWRGVLQPLLQRHMAPLWAGLAVGTVWGVWHLPAFFLSGTPQSAWGFLPFLAGSVAVGVIVTGMVNAARGSLLLPVLAHAQLNSPLWPDAQPNDTVFFVALAALVVALDARAMFTRTGAATAVIPPVSDPLR